MKRKIITQALLFCCMTFQGKASVTNFIIRPVVSNYQFVADVGTWSGRALEERRMVAGNTTLFLPRSASGQACLVALKQGIESIIGSFADYSLADNDSFETYFMSDTDASSIPAWTTTGLVAYLNIPTNYFSYSPWHTDDSDYGWNYLDDALSMLRWWIPSSCAWYATFEYETGNFLFETFQGYEPDDIFLRQNESCRWDPSSGAASTTLTNLFISGSGSVSAHFYQEMIDLLDCDGYSGYTPLLDPVHDDDRQKWSGYVATVLNTTNFLCSGETFIKRHGLLRIDDDASYSSFLCDPTDAGIPQWEVNSGSTVPPAWTNRDDHFVVWDSSMSLSDGYAMGTTLFDEQDQFLSIVSTGGSLKADCFYDRDCGDPFGNCDGGHGWSYGDEGGVYGGTSRCPFNVETHCYYSALVAANRGPQMSDSSFYFIATHQPSVLSVVKYDIAGGFKYLDDNP